VRFGPSDYKNSAEENLQAANLCREGSYVASHYLSGLAAECILRAYRWRIDPSWHGRHALPRLYKAARFDHLLSSAERLSFDLLVTRWSNEHRYFSSQQLTRFLNQIGATHNVRGDKLKDNARQMYNAAEAIVRTGVAKWQ